MNKILNLVLILAVMLSILATESSAIDLEQKSLKQLLLSSSLINPMGFSTKKHHEEHNESSKKDEKKKKEEPKPVVKPEEKTEKKPEEPKTEEKKDDVKKEDKGVQSAMDKKIHKAYGKKVSKTNEGDQGVLANALKYFFDYGFGSPMYAFKLPLTMIPYSVTYLPVMAVDFFFNGIFPKWNDTLDCKWFGNNCRDKWLIVILR